MKTKRILAALLVVMMLISIMPMAVFAETEDVASTSKDPTKYVELQGDWNFKLYRGYSAMYQYQPYGRCTVKWEDNELAKVPTVDTFKEWETFAMPNGDEITGGLLAQKREDGSALFPTWHEAWACRTFEVPADFTKDDTVTLLLGVIDDADVVYINGTAVASSGFVNGDGEKIVNDLELGGFDLGNVNFEKSYWEVAREYKIPASCIKQGETNEICVRVFNNNSLGGMYNGRVYALCGNDTAVRYLKGLPYVEVEDAGILAASDELVAAQTAAIEANDMTAFAATIADDYNNDGVVKADRVAEMTALLEGKENIKVTDTDACLCESDDVYAYLAKREIKAGDEVIFSGDIFYVFAGDENGLLERGNWNRCYTTSYYSELFGQDLGYSVWLPPSYFKNPDQKYPVVYLLHGQNSSSVSYLNVDNIGGFMDNLTAAGKVIDMIVVMPDSGKNAFYRDSELSDDGTSSGPWATQLSNELRLYIEANYRTMNDAKFRGMTGNSMGGYGTYTVGVGNPDIYSSFAAHMGYLPGDVDNVLKALTEEELAACDFYLDCGLQDQTVGTGGTIRVHELLDSLGKEHFYELRDGIHGSAFYMGSMDKSMMFHSEHFKKNMAADDAAANDPTKYVELQGDWNFKLYRTYTQMYQYQPYGMCNVKWEDAELAKVPNADIFGEWDVYAMPADDPATGGLLSNEISPTWSEGWACRTFEVPADFTESDTVTLLMGVIDDADVIYINGTPVASSGFAGADGKPILNTLELGGFDQGNVNFEKSYWEVAREYTIPTSCLNLGGTNEICIRVFNNNSLGGFYSGRVYALCGNEIAARYLKGIPYVDVTNVGAKVWVLNAVNTQIAALEANDMEAFAATVAENYHNDAATKADRVAEMTALLEGKENIKVTDSNAKLYVSGDAYAYVADREIKAGADVLFSGEVTITYASVDGKMLERGNWNRCYTTEYYSNLFSKNLGYSVWLPPSYYTNPDQKYPVVYLLHGQNSSSVSYLNVDNIGGFMDKLAADGKIVDMIVIMPDSGKNAFYRDSELSDDGTSSGPWATQLSNELRLYVEDNYRTLNYPQFRAMTGNSMGGYGTYTVGVGNPDIYTSFAAHMGYLPGDVDNVLKALTEEELAACDFYLDCGLQDQTVGTGGTIRVHELLDSLGKDHFYELRDGIHGSAFYMGSMDKSMKFHSDHFAKYLCPFVDISEDGLANEIIDAYYEGLVLGTDETHFTPAESVTRAQFILMLWRAAGCPEFDGTDVDFADKADIDECYMKAIEWGVAEGIILGNAEDNTFRPNDNITRAQMAAMMYRYLCSLYGEFSVASYGFVDEAQFEEYFVDSINAIANLGIMLGVDFAPTFDSQSNATRAMSAAVILRTVKYIAENPLPEPEKMVLNEWPDTSVMPERDNENPTWPSVTGYFKYTTKVGEVDRDIYEYIPEEMGTKRPTVIVAGPNGSDPLTFLLESGWKAVADSYKFDIVLAVAKDGVWGTPESEDAYIDAVVKYCTANMLYRHGGQCAFYLAGYKEGADVLAYQLVTYPQFYAGAALLDTTGVDPALLEQMKTTASPDPNRMMSEVPVQVWISGEESDNLRALADYFIAANNCSTKDTLVYSDKYADELYHPLGWLAKTNQITDADVCNVYVNTSGLNEINGEFTEYLWGDVLRHVQWAPAFTNLRATRYWAEPEELGFVRETLKVDGVNREMYIYVPESVKDDDNVPMVICFHGMNVNGNESAVRYGWSKVAEERGFIVVCPTGSQQANSFATNFVWSPATDVPFVSALIDYMIENYPVDAERVYTTGSSMGSMMAMWCQCFIPEKLAASASYDMVMTLSDYKAVTLNDGTAFNEDITIALMAISGSYDPSYNSGLSTDTPKAAFTKMETYMKDRLGLNDPMFYKNGNYEFYYYNNDAGVPLFVFEDCITRIHADMPEDCYVCYDYMAKFSRDAEGTLYYMGVAVD